MKRKINTLLVIHVIIIYLFPVQAQWKSEVSPSRNNLNSIFMINESSGCVVGDKGTIMIKSEGRWELVKNVTEENLYCITMVKENIGWAVGSKGTILHYDGVKWNLVDSPTSETLFSVSFRNEEYGIAVGSRGAILVYKEGKWNQLPNKSIGNFYSISLRNGIAIAGGGFEYYKMPIVKIESQSGLKITKMFDPDHAVIKSIAVPDRSSIWAVGLAGAIYHLDGIVWSKIEPFPIMPTLTSVYFSDLETGIACGYGGTILTYSANNWNLEETPVTSRLNSAFIKGSTYYAVGSGGIIVSMKKSSGSSDDFKNSSPEVISLESYPNPVVGTLSVIIPPNEGFRNGLLTITNVYGKTVLMKTLENLIGGYNHEVDVSGLSSGLYLIRIKGSGNQVASGKFIVKK